MGTNQGISMLNGSRINSKICRLVVEEVVVVMPHVVAVVELSFLTKSTAIKDEVVSK